MRRRCRAARGRCPVHGGYPRPAAAPGTDLALAVTGTTIAADAAGKFGSLKVSNVGTEVPPQVLLSFDLAGLDLSKVELDLDACDQRDDEIRCGLEDEFIPGPGETADLGFPFVRKDGATGAAGSLTVTLDGPRGHQRDERHRHRRRLRRWRRRRSEGGGR